MNIVKKQRLSVTKVTHAANPLPSSHYAATPSSAHTQLQK